MVTPDAQALAAQLQTALGLSIVCGQVTLNFNNGDLQSVETRTFQRLTSAKSVDKRAAMRA